MLTAILIMLILIFFINVSFIGILGDILKALGKDKDN